MVIIPTMRNDLSGGSLTFPETYPEGLLDHGSVSSGTVTVDASVAGYHKITVTGNITLQVGGGTAGKVTPVTIEITDGGAHTVQFTAAGGLTTPGGIVPALSVSGKDIIEGVISSTGIVLFPAGYDIKTPGA
ncbi:hypothetical protein ACFL6N_06140 [Thermodesulfobacteriota bacterium]